RETADIGGSIFTHAEGYRKSTSSGIWSAPWRLRLPNLPHQAQVTDGNDGVHIAKRDRPDPII
ncbi:MAG: hypothetical protein RX317_05935, partial [bacterium]|nr:hypothetical protein [bacterium]